jgi:hypothetical protein
LKNTGVRGEAEGLWTGVNAEVGVIDGTYGFAYCGTHGLGMGVFTVRGQDFVGVDAGGVQYAGTAQESEDGSNTLDIELTMPAGASIAQRASSQIVPQVRHIQATMPAAFGDGKPQEVTAPPGTITVMVKRVRDGFLTAGQSATLSDVHRLAATTDAYFKPGG